MKISTAKKITPQVAAEKEAVVAPVEPPVVETEETEETVAPPVEPPVVEPTTDEETVLVSAPIDLANKDIDVAVTLASTSDPIVVAEPVVVESTEVRFIKEYINNYRKVISEKLPNPEKCNESFAKILRYAISKQTSTDVLDALYAFFNEFKLSFLAPQKALSGVSSYNKGTREKMQIAYMLMYELVTGGKGPLDFQYASKVLEGSGFVTYVANRMKK
jgi:hypothetical protein